MEFLRRISRNLENSCKLHPGGIGMKGSLSMTFNGNMVNGLVRAPMGSGLWLSQTCDLPSLATTMKLPVPFGHLMANVSYGDSMQEVSWTLVPTVSLILGRIDIKQWQDAALLLKETPVSSPTTKKERGLISKFRAMFSRVGKK